MASRSLAYRKLRRRGIPQFMGRASVLVQPRAEPRALWKSLSFAEHLVGGAHPVVLTQQGTQWCWAAVCQALLALDAVSKTQQDIVSVHTGRQCEIPSDGLDMRASCTANTGCAVPCDQPHSLVRGMEGLGHPLNRIFQPDLSQLKLALADRPVAAQVQFDLGGGHMILITGWTGLGSNPTVRYLCPFLSEAAPFPVQPQANSWNDLKDGVSLMGGDARLSHIYPRP